MAAGPRTPARPGAGPGRGQRPRAASRRPPAPVHAPSEATPAEEPAASGAHAVRVRRPRGSLTTRAIALAVVFLVLTISYASSLRIYFAQSAEIAGTRREIAERQARIADLQTDLTRWQNPAYVQTQARTRLGWVLPGETGFKVVGEDGRPLGGGPEITASEAPKPPQDVWWDKLWGSVEAADKPAPARPKPADLPPITESTKPSPSASPADVSSGRPGTR